MVPPQFLSNQGLKDMLKTLGNYVLNILNQELKLSLSKQQFDFYNDGLLNNQVSLATIVNLANSSDINVAINLVSTFVSYFITGYVNSEYYFILKSKFTDTSFNFINFLSSSIDHFRKRSLLPNHEHKDLIKLMREMQERSLTTDSDLLYITIEVVKMIVDNTKNSLTDEQLNEMP